MPTGVYKHKNRHGMKGTRIYESWQAMKARCLNKNRPDYKDWEGRGITVCKEWLDFKNFYKDMGERPENKSLDRIDNNKGYYKKNCKWSSPIEQSNNTRKNVFITYNNKTQTVSQWSEELGINCNKLFGRLKANWNVNKILNTK